MNRKSFFIPGTILGVPLASIAIMCHVPPVVLTLAALVVIFGICVSLAFYLTCTKRYHPQPLDYYGLHKFLLGSALAASVIGCLVAAVLKIASLFSLDIVTASAFAMTGLLFYLGICFMCYTAIRSEWA